MTGDSTLRLRRIEQIIPETPRIKTVQFCEDLPAKPGQFIMVWIPDVDEIPMSLSYIGPLKGFSVQSVGQATIALHQMKENDLLGIRGPFGRGFEIDKHESILAVAGGCGIAPIAPFIERAKSDGLNATVLLGVRSESDLFFQSRFETLEADVRIYSEDGSTGRRGFVTRDVPELLASSHYDLIVSCGPEPMLKRVVDMASDAGIEVQVSIERYIKCGLGLCDSCSIDGLQVCRDGPVFYGSDLRGKQEFGRYRRGASGNRIEL